jgi:hypothetical protein
MYKRVFAVLFGIAACSRGDAKTTTDSAAGDVAQDPPTRAARLTSIEGAVSLEAPGSTSWTQPPSNYTLTTGDRLNAGSNARAELDLGSGAVRLDHGGDLSVTNLTDHFTQLGLDQGAIEASLYRYDHADSIEFDTPNGALVPRDAGTYIVSIEPNDGGTVVSVEKGSLEVSGPGLDQTLNAGQTVRLVGTNPIQIIALGSSYVQSEPRFSDLDRWRARRDPLYTSTGYSSRYVSTSIPGWEDLDDYGTWFNDASSTAVWCPTHVTRTWVPYRDGRWAWVEPWGWTWVDDEPWGYAPFHYGRWETVATNDCGSGWAWVPGPVVARPVWGPAFVAFLAGSTFGFGYGRGVEAWFPLGPREPFFPWYRYSDRYLREVNVTNLIEVRNVDPLIRDRDYQRIRWANRDRGFTAVSSAAFSGGDPIGGRSLRVPSSRLDVARVTSGPSARPGRELVAGGHSVPAPRFAERPRTLVTRATRGAERQQREVAGAARGGRGMTEPRGVAVAPPAGARERPGRVIERNALPQPPRGGQRSVGGEVGLPPARGGRMNNPPTERHGAPSQPMAAPRERGRPSQPPPATRPQPTVTRERSAPQRSAPQPAPQPAPQRAQPAPQRAQPQPRPQRAQPPQRPQPVPKPAQPQPSKQPDKGRGKPPGGPGQR